MALDRAGHYAVVGPLMRLHLAYDPAQLWLPFVVALVTPPVPEMRVPLARSGKAMQRLQAQVYARDGRRNQSSVPYYHERGVAQYGLPFVETRMVDPAEWGVLQGLGFPGWDLHDGHPASLSVGNQTETEVERWLLDNCRGRFRVSRRYIRFERLSDYAMAKLRFS